MNRDIPDGSVAVGVPAKVIGTFDEYVERRIKEETYPADIPLHKVVNGRTEFKINEDLVKWCWEKFEREKAAEERQQ